MACDNHQAGDIKALQKGQQLLDRERQEEIIEEKRMPSMSRTWREDVERWSGPDNRAYEKSAPVFRVCVWTADVFVTITLYSTTAGRQDISHEGRTLETIRGGVTVGTGTMQFIS